MEQSMMPQESVSSHATPARGDRQGGAHIDSVVMGDHALFVGRDQVIQYAERVVIAEGAEAQPPTPGEPPYQGMHYFDVADAPRFFGRERLTAELVGALREQNLLAVIGASGSGKSSLVRAGIVAAIRRGAPLEGGVLPPLGSDQWPIYLITPSAHPLESLARQVMADPRAGTALIHAMLEAPDALHRYLRERLPAEAGGCLLVVDQFEEIFTLCADRAVRQAFVANLLYSAGITTGDDGSGPDVGPVPVTRVILALRADFYDQCSDFPALRHTLERYQRYIGAMSPAELQRAIELPAQRGGWAFQQGLVELLLRDVGDEPGTLPLLSHALLETWKRRSGRTMTLAGYHAAGGVRGAIARTAQQVYEAMTGAQQSIARRTFLELTELGEDAPDTRRRVSLNQLILDPEQRRSLDEVLETLVEARLVTRDDPPEEGGEVDEGPVVEVAHEALIREWPTLRRWLDESRAALRVHRALAAAAQQWRTLEQDPEILYRGARLTQALEWQREHAGGLHPLEREFLEASAAQRQREVEEQERRQRERLEAAQRLAAAQAQTVRRGRILNVVLLVLLVVGGITLYSTQQQLSAWRGEELMKEARVLKAEAVDAADAEAAIALFERAARSDPDLREDAESEKADVRRRVATLLVQEGEALAREGHYDQAGEKFKEARSLKPPPDTPLYVWIDAGSFTMGSRESDLQWAISQCEQFQEEFPRWECSEAIFGSEKPPTDTLSLDGYWIMRTEVTNALYQRCLDESGCRVEPGNERWKHPELANQPVTDVSWFQATRYAAWVGGRLPTEAEWEKACRGPAARTFPWGDDAERVGSVNYIDSPSGAWADVGSYPDDRSPYGILDMAGNVREWTSSKYYYPYPYNERDGREQPGGLEPRVFRGGSFHIPDLSRFPNFIHCSHREREYPERNYSNVGFRVVISPD